MRFQSQYMMDYFDYLEVLVGQKQQPTRALVEHEIPEMLARAEQYLAALAMSTGLTRHSWDQDTACAMIACYESPTEVLKHLKDVCFENLALENVVNIQRCPYCMLCEPHTWDHFLPKARYPEFAVFHRNLVYVCWQCNHQKDDDYSEVRLEFLHPSFTVDPVIPLLHCKVQVTGKNLSIRFYCALHNANDERANVAKRHAKNLDLFRRYQLESASLFSSFIGDLARDCPNGIAESNWVASVTHRFQRVSDDLGPNAWEARFWNGILCCNDIHKYANARIRAHKPNIRQGAEIVAPLEN